MCRFGIKERDIMQIAAQQEILRSEESGYDHRLHGILLICNGFSCNKVSEIFSHSLRAFQYWSTVLRRVVSKVWKKRHARVQGRNVEIKKLRRLAAKEKIDLLFEDECHFQQQGTRYTMWIPPENINPVVLLSPTRKGFGVFGAVRV